MIHNPMVNATKADGVSKTAVIRATVSNRISPTELRDRRRIPGRIVPVRLLH